jgi:hypothetical protein
MCKFQLGILHLLLIGRLRNLVGTDDGDQDFDCSEEYSLNHSVLEPFCSLRSMQVIKPCILQTVLANISAPESCPELDGKTSETRILSDSDTAPL